MESLPAFLGDIPRILQVFRTETWLTVYRPLDILKLFGGPTGCLGQRLSMAEALGNEDSIKNVSGSRVEVLIRF